MEVESSDLQCHAMIIKQLLSKCLLLIVLLKRMKIKIQLLMGLKALAVLKNLLSSFFSFDVSLKQILRQILVLIII